jgi:hypothetical protein
VLEFAWSLTAVGVGAVIVPHDASVPSVVKNFPELFVCDGSVVALADM